MARKKIKSSTDQRPFIMVYHDFLDSDILNSYEKIVFIALKKFADSENKCFPSLKKLSDVTRLSKRKIQDTLKELEKKRIINIEKRQRENGGNTSNLYTLYDFKELWNAESSEEITEAIDEYEDKKLISMLESRGYTVTKEKEPETLSAGQSNNASSTQLNQSNMFNTTTDSEKSQESDQNTMSDTKKRSESRKNVMSDSKRSQKTERYTMEQIKQLFDYDIMINDYQQLEEDIDVIFNILYDALNCTNDTIRIDSQDKPAMTVIAKLMKLESRELIYSIEKYHEQQGRIKNVKSYMLTILYNAKEQCHLDLMNLGHYNGDF